jgi:hypothetical protein
LVACICACLHHRMRVAVVWLLWARLCACELCVWLPAYRFGSRLARSLKHPEPGSLNTSRLVASSEPSSSDPGSYSQIGERNQPNRPNVYAYNLAAVVIGDARWDRTVFYSVFQPAPTCPGTNNPASRATGRGDALPAVRAFHSDARTHARTRFAIHALHMHLLCRTPVANLAVPCF